MKHFLIPESDYNLIEESRENIYNVINSLELDTKIKTYLILSIIPVTNKLYYVSHRKYNNISFKPILLLIEFINWLQLKLYNLKKLYHCKKYCNKVTFMLLNDNSVVFFGERLKYKRIKLNTDQLKKYFGNPEEHYNNVYKLNSDQLDIFESLYYGVKIWKDNKI